MSASLIGGNELGLLDTSLFILNRNDATGNHVVGGDENLFINVSNGNLMIQHQDTYMPSRGQDFNLMRTYNVRGISSYDLEHKHDQWFMSSWIKLERSLNGKCLHVHYGDGSVFDYHWDESRGLFVSTDGNGAYETIEQLDVHCDESPAYILTRADQSTVGFSRWGQMVFTEDANGVRTEYFYKFNRLCKIVDDTGHVVNYEYKEGHLYRVVDETEGVLVKYIYKCGKLVEVIDRYGHSTRYKYNFEGFLIEIELPEKQMVNGKLQTFGEREIKFEYDRVCLKGDFGKISVVLTKMIDAQGGVTTFDYNYEQKTKQDHDSSYGNWNHGDWNEKAENSTRVVDALGNARAYSNKKEYVAWRTENGFYAIYRDRSHRIAAEAEVIRSQHAMTYTYLSNGYISEVVDQKGFHSSYEYNQKGDLIAMTDNNGWGIVHSDSVYYRDLRKAQGVVDLAGEGKLSCDLTCAESKALEELYTSHYEYDTHGNLIRLEDNNGSVSTFTYTDFDKVKTATSAEGNSLVKDDDDYSRSQRVELGFAEFVADLSDADKDAILALYTSYFEYDANTNLIRKTDAGGDITEFSYDEYGNQIQRTVYLDANDLLDPSQQQVTQYDYDMFGNLIRVTDGEGIVTRSAYDHFGNLTQYTDGNGGVTYYTYDADNRLLSVTDPEGNVTTYAYDAVGNRISTTDARGHTVTRIYDLNNHLIKVFDPSVDHTGSRMTRYCYDILGNQTVVIDAEGRKTRYSYNVRRELIEVTSAKVEDQEQGARCYTTSYQYDGMGQRIVINDNNGNQTQLVYNEDGLLHQQTDPIGHITQIVYDDNNNQITIIAGLQLPEARRQITRFAYDEEDQLIRNIDAEGNETGFEYDAVGNRVALIDARAYAGDTSSNFRTEYEYDLANRLIREIKPEVVDPETGQAVRYTREYQYDANGNRISITNENGETRHLYFDKNDRQILLEDENQVFTAFTYDELDNRTSVQIGVDIARNLNGELVFVDPGQTEAQIDNTDNAQVMSYVYDEFNQLISQTDGMGYALAFNNTTLYQQLRAEMGYAADVAALSQADRDALLESRTQHLSYDRVGNLLQQIDHLDRSNSFQYDALNRVISTTNALGDTVKSSYDGNSNLLWQQDELNRISRFTYDGNNRLTRIAEAVGSAIEVATRNVYDDFGNQIERVRADGSVDQRSVKYQYDLNNRLTATINEEGHSESYEYDAVGNRIALTDGRNNRTQFVYDALNRNIKIIDAKTFETRYEYDGVGNRISIIDANGHVSRFDFDPGNRMISTKQIMDEGADRMTTYQYDVRGNRIEMRTAVGTGDEELTTFEYDAQNNLIKVSDAEGGVSTSRYDAVYNLVHSTDAEGNSTSSEFDALNRVVRVVDALGGVTSYSYDAVGNRLNVTDANNNSVSYVYDERNRNTIMRLDSDGVETLYSYDDVDNRTSITYAAGLPEQAIERFEYYADDKLKARIDGEGNRTEYTYDEANNRTSVTDPSNNTTQYDYDANNRVQFITDAEGNVVEYRYDGNGNRIQVIDGEGNRQTSYYNAANQIKYTVDGEGYVTHYAYDANGNVRTQTLYYDAVAVPMTDTELAQEPVPVANAQGRDQVQHFEYDLLNRLTAKVDGEGYRLEYSYDKVGNRTLTRQYMTLDGSRVQETRSYYDDLYRETHMVSAEGYLTVMEYDALGNMLKRSQYDSPVVVPVSGLPQPKAGDQVRVTQMTYDHNNRVTLEISPKLIQTVHVYDKRGNRVSTTEAANTQLARTTATVYDKANRVTDIIEAQGTEVAKTTHFELYANGQVRQRHDAYGSADVVVTDFIYDGNNRVVEKRMPFGDGEQVIETYGYDGAGNRTSWIRAFGTADASVYYYEYDSNNRMVAEDLPYLGSERVLNTYKYDAAGNRVLANYAVGYNEARSQRWDYDNDNRMVSIIDGEGVETRYVYDGADNLVSKQQAYGHPDEAMRETKYEYDLENRLIRETSAELLTTEYEYDVLNNRTLVRKLVDESSGQYAETHQYFDILGRQTHTISAEGYLTVISYDDLNRVSSKTLYSDRVAVPQAGLPQVDMDNLARPTEYFYDAQDRVIREVRADGFITEYGYDVRGNRRYVFEGVSYDNNGTRLGELRTTEYLYSDADQITDEIRALGTDAEVRTHYDINAHGQVSARYDAYLSTDQRVTSFEYDHQDRVILETLPVISDGQPFDIQTRYEYNAFGELRYRTDGLGSVDERVIEYRYDDKGQLTLEINGENEATFYAYDALGNQTTITTGYGSLDVRTTRYEFDLDNRRTARIDAEQVRSEYVYDGLGNLIEETLAAGTPEARTTTYEYDLESRLLLKTTPMGATTEYVYDVLGNQTRIIQLHDFDDPTTTVDESRYATTYQYFDILGRMTDSVSPQGYLTTHHYDDLGNVTDTWLFAEPVVVTDDSVAPLVTPDATTRHTQYIYDARDRLIQETNPLDQTTAYRYDARDNRIEVLEMFDVNTQVGLRNTFFEYDKADRQTAIIEAAGSIDEVRSESIYNAHGEVIEQRDAVGSAAERSVQFDYDKAGRLVTQHNWVTDVYGIDHQLVMAYQYDEVGNLRFEYAGEQDASGNWIVDPYNGQQLFQTEYQYDLENRLRFELRGSNSADLETTETGYDAVGNKTLTRIVLGSEEIIENRFIYDLDNRVVEAYDGENVLTVYTYDALGNKLTAELAPGNATEARLTRYTYDLADRVVSVKDPMGGLTAYVYDVLGNQTLIIGADNVAQENRFDMLGRLEVSLSEGGVKTVNHYDEFGNLIDSSQGWDDGLGIASKLFGGDVRLTRYDYDLRGNQTRITDPEGYSTLIKYDELNRQTRVENGHYLPQPGDPDYDASLAALEHISSSDFDYDAKDRVIMTTDGEGNESVSQYDARDNKVRFTEAFNELANTIARTTEYEYNTAGREVEVRTPEGGITISDYDAAGRLIEKRVLQSLDGELQAWITTLYSYDGNNNLATETDDYGTVTRHAYDVAGNLTDTWMAWGSVDERHTGMEYDLLNRKTADIDGEGNRTEYRVDLVGNQTQVTDAEGRKAYYYYDQGNRLLAVVDALGLVSTFEYDSAGNQTNLYAYANSIAQSFNNLSAAEKQDYSIVSALFSANTQHDRQVINEFDGNNRVIVTIAADESRTEITYDGAGNKYTEINYANSAEPRTLEYRYDADNRLVEFTDIDGAVTTFGYDAANNKVLETITANADSIDPNKKRSTRYEYDLNNRQTRQIFDEFGLNIVQQQAYDLVGNLISYIDGNNAETRYEYDLNNRLKAEVDALGNSQLYEYDRVGNRTSYINRRGIEFTYAYDDNNRMRYEYLPAQNVVRYDGLDWKESLRTDLVIEHQYDAFGNETRTIDANGNSTTRFFDANGRMTTEVQADGVLHTYEYNAYGDKRAEVIYMSPGLLNNIHGQGNPQQPDPADYATVTKREFKYSYDRAGRLVLTTLPEITVSSWDETTLAITDTTLRPTIENIYDDFGNIILTIDQKGARTFNYYDNRNRVTKSVDAEGYVTAWLYDDQDNVLEQRTYTTAIDAAYLATMNENKLDLPANLGPYHQVNRMYDAAGRMLSEMQPEISVWHHGEIAPTRTRPVTTFEYDAEGNQIRKTLGAGSQVEQNEYYFYDASNNMRAFINQGGVVHYYQYDGNGNVTTQARYYTPITSNLADLTLSDVLQHIAGNADVENDQITRFEYTTLDKVSKETSLLIDGNIDTKRDYDAVGNETRSMAAQAADETVAYTTHVAYDAMNRLVRTEAPDGTGSVIEYDAVGNEVKKYTGDISFVPNTPLASEITASMADSLTITWKDASSSSNASTNGRRFVAWSTTSHPKAVDLNGYTASGMTNSDDIVVDVGKQTEQVYFRVVSVDAGGNRSVSEEFSLKIPPRISELSVTQQGSHSLITASFNIPEGVDISPVLHTGIDSYAMTATADGYQAAVPTALLGDYSISWDYNGQTYDSRSFSLASSAEHYLTTTDIAHVGTVNDGTGTMHELAFSVSLPDGLTDLAGLSLEWESLDNDAIYGELSQFENLTGGNTVTFTMNDGETQGEEIPAGRYQISVVGTDHEGNIVLDRFVIDLQSDGTTTSITPSSNLGLTIAVNPELASSEQLGGLLVVDGKALNMVDEQGYVSASLEGAGSNYDLFIGEQSVSPHLTSIKRNDVLDNNVLTEYEFVVQVELDQQEIDTINGDLMLAWRPAGSGTAFTNQQALTQNGVSFSSTLNGLSLDDYDFKIYYSNNDGNEVIVDWLRVSEADSGTVLSNANSLTVLAEEQNGSINGDVVTTGNYFGKISQVSDPEVATISSVAGTQLFNIVTSGTENGYYTEKSYNALDAVIAETAEDGIVRTFKVDAAGNQVVSWEWGLEGIGHNQTINVDSYREFDNLNREVRMLGQSVELSEYVFTGSFNEGVLTQTQKRLDSQKVYDYAGNLIRNIQDDGSMMEYRFNAVGIQTAEFHRNSAGTTEKGNFKQFDELGHVTAEYDHLGHGQANAYDNRGRMIAQYNTRFDLNGVNLNQTSDFNTAINLVVNGATEVTQFGYDDFDRQTSTTDAQRIKGDLSNDGVQVVSRTQYDQMDRVVTLTDAIGGTQQFSYDGRGNRIEQIFPNGYRIEQVFDAFGRVSQTIHHYTRYTNNNTRVSVNSAGYQTVATESLEYDIFGNQIKSVDAEGRVVSRLFGPAERLLQETDENGVTTFHEYDDWGRLIHSYSDKPVPGASQKKNIFRQYDARGLLTEIRDEATGVTTNYSYNDDGLRSSEYVHTGGANDRDIVYSYADNGDLVLWYDRISGLNLHYLYDTAGNLKQTQTMNFDSQLGGFTEFIQLVDNLLVDIADDRTQVSYEASHISVSDGEGGTTSRIKNGYVAVANGEPVNPFKHTGYDYFRIDYYGSDGEKLRQWVKDHHPEINLDQYDTYFGKRVVELDFGDDGGFYHGSRVVSNYQENRVQDILNGSSLKLRTSYWSNLRAPENRLALLGLLRQVGFEAELGALHRSGDQVFSEVVYEYDDANRLTSANETFYQSNGNVDQSRTNSYSYFADGRRASWTVTNALGDQKTGTYVSNTTHSYEYNERGLLKRSINTSGNVEATWSYDSNGNITYYEEKHNGNTRYRQSTAYQSNNVAYETNTRALDDDNKLAPNTRRTSYFDKTGRELRYYSDGESDTYGWTDYYADGRKSREHLDGGGKIKHTQTYFNYDANGKMSRFVKDRGTKQDRSEAASFVYDNDGKIIHKAYTPPKGGTVRKDADYFYANGNAIGQVGKAEDKPMAGLRNVEIGTASYNLVDQFGRDMPGKSVSSFTAQGGETLQQVASIYFGNPSLWFVIAEANGLSPTATLVAGQSIEIPTHIESGRITSETHKVYSETEIIGNTTPNVKQKSSKCASFIMIIITIAIVVVAAMVIGPLAANIGAALFGAAAGTAAATVASYAIAGAILGAASSIVTQGVAIALGLQESFDWGKVGQEALAGALSGAATGLGQAVKAGTISKSMADIARTSSKALQAASAAVKSMDKDGKVTSWTSVVAAYIAGPSGSQLDGSVGPIFQAEGLQATFLQYGTPWLGLVETYVREGELTTDDWLGAIASTVGTVIDANVKTGGFEGVAQRSALKALAGGAIGSFSDTPDFAFGLISNSVGNELGNYLGQSIVKATGLDVANARIAVAQRKMYFENNPDAFDAYQKDTLNELVNVIAEKNGEESVKKLRAGIENGSITLDVLIADIGKDRGQTLGSNVTLNSALVNDSNNSDISSASAIGVGIEEIYERLFNIIDPADTIKGDEGAIYAARFIKGVVDSGAQNFSFFVKGNSGVLGFASTASSLQRVLTTQFTPARLAADIEFNGIEFSTDNIRGLFESAEEYAKARETYTAFADNANNLSELANKVESDDNYYDVFIADYNENGTESLAYKLLTRSIGEQGIEYLKGNRKEMSKIIRFKAKYSEALANEGFTALGLNTISIGDLGISERYQNFINEHVEGISDNAIRGIGLQEYEILDSNIPFFVSKDYRDAYHAIGLSGVISARDASDAIVNQNRQMLKLVDAAADFPVIGSLVSAAQGSIESMEFAASIIDLQQKITESGADTNTITGGVAAAGTTAILNKVADELGGVRNPAVQSALKKAIKIGFKVANKGESALTSWFKVLKFVPGGKKIADKALNLPTGTKAEAIVGSVFSLSGLFDEVHSYQNPSGWGVDILTKTHQGEWIGFEIKASTQNKWLKLSKQQKKGPTSYINRKLDEGLSSYRNWKSADTETIDLARRVRKEQRLFNDQYNESAGGALTNRDRNFFDGFVIHAKNIENNRKVDVRFTDWIAKTKK